MLFKEGLTVRIETDEDLSEAVVALRELERGGVDTSLVKKTWVELSVPEWGRDMFRREMIRVLGHCIHAYAIQRYDNLKNENRQLRRKVKDLEENAKVNAERLSQARKKTKMVVSDEILKAIETAADKVSAPLSFDDPKVGTVINCAVDVIQEMHYDCPKTERPVSPNYMRFPALSEALIRLLGEDVFKKRGP